MVASSSVTREHQGQTTNKIIIIEYERHKDCINKAINYNRKGEGGRVKCRDGNVQEAGSG